jgi:hypothetical protein
MAQFWCSFHFATVFPFLSLAGKACRKAKKIPRSGGIPGGHIMPVFFDFTPFSLFPAGVLNLSRKSAGNRPFKLNVN